MPSGSPTSVKSRSTPESLQNLECPLTIGCQGDSVAERAQDLRGERAHIVVVFHDEVVAAGEAEDRFTGACAHRGRDLRLLSTP
jgi:hypothetical protein